MPGRRYHKEDFSRLLKGEESDMQALLRFGIISRSDPGAISD
jgi:hypothetical protein